MEGKKVGQCLWIQIQILVLLKITVDVLICVTASSRVQSFCEESEGLAYISGFAVK